MIEQLVTVPQSRSRAALMAVIEKARYHCAAFGSDLDFVAPMWDITDHCPRPTNKAQGKSRIYFTGHEGGTSKSMKGRRPLGEPFCSLLKAIIRLKQDARPQSADPHIRLSHAGRDLAAEFGERGYDPCLLLAEDFDAAARRINRRSTGATRYKLGQALEEIASFIDKWGITPVRLDWSNPIAKTSNARDRTTNVAELARVEKMPAKDVLDALAEIWQKIDDPSDIILMGCVTLLHCAPWRIVEVLRLSRDCEVYEQKEGPDGAEYDANGGPIMRYGIRYWREKSGEPDIKWIPTVMVEVAKTAIERIRKATSEANALALWLSNNPGRAWLPCADFPELSLSVKDVQSFFGFANPPAALTWLRNRDVPLDDTRKVNTKFGPKTVIMVSRADLEAALLQLVPKISDGAAEAPLHQRLFVSFANQHHASRAPNPCQLQIVSDQQLRDFLGGRQERGRTTVKSAFERLLGRPDLTANTQQFRHWLNTLSQAGGLEQGLIARWSGRESVEQNAEYDHLTPTELAETLRKPLASGMAIGVLADIQISLPPVERQAYRETVVATAHVTEIGFCVHDWNAIPCPEFGACSTCTSLVFTKGDTKHYLRTKEIHEETAWIIGRLQKEIDEGTRGASNHYRTMAAKLDSLDRILAFHADPSIPAGTLIQPTGWSPPHLVKEQVKAS